MRDTTRAGPGHPSIHASVTRKSAADANDGNKQRQRTHGWPRASSPSQKVRRRVPNIPQPGPPAPRTLGPEQHCGPHACCSKRPRGRPRQDTNGIAQRPFLHHPPRLCTRGDGANSGMGVRSDPRCPPPPIQPRPSTGPRWSPHQESSIPLPAPASTLQPGRPCGPHACGSKRPRGTTTR